MAEHMDDETIRPLCDHVSCLAPEEVDYTISFTYWIAESNQRSASEIQSKVTAAVKDFQAWQRKLGRDINPTGADRPPAGGGGKAGEADSPGGCGRADHDAAEMHRRDGDLRRAGG